MLELTCTCMTFSKVLETSGHVAKFSDYMVKDVEKGFCYRADKLIDEFISKKLEKDKKKIKPEEKEKLLKIAADCENYSANELNDCIKTLKIKSPETGNALTEAEQFNLMFGTEIGPTGQL